MWGRILALIFGEAKEKEGHDQKESEEKGEEDEEEKEEEEKDEDAEETVWAARSRQLRAAGGLIGVYVFWTIASYFTFGAIDAWRIGESAIDPFPLTVFGMVIYRSLSPAAEQTFATTWGVSQALDQAQQWKGA
jgi:hypothetical protein